MFSESDLSFDIANSQRSALPSQDSESTADPMAILVPDPLGNSNNGDVADSIPIAELNVIFSKAKHNVASSVATKRANSHAALLAELSASENSMHPVGDSQDCSESKLFKKLI